MLLGDVRELEVETERSQNVGLLVGRQRPHGVADGTGVAGFARIARTQPDPLLRLEQLVALPARRGPAQDVAEQTNVAAERSVRLRTCVRAHGGRLSEGSDNAA